MRQIIDQGAEGRIYKEDFFGRPAIVKERFIKSYRHPCLDKQLSYQRLKSEVRCISRCRAAGNFVEGDCRWTRSYSSINLFSNFTMLGVFQSFTYFFHTDTKASNLNLVFVFELTARRLLFIT